MIEIDGSYLEGGGQVVRTAVALSAVTGKGVRIFNIRGKRTPPGLKAQHMNAVNAVAKLCGAEVEGLELGSEEIIFKPGEIKSQHLEVNIGTAGSITLVLQALLPAAIFSEKEFTFIIIGGTHVHWSPPYEYFQHIFCDYLRRMGVNIDTEILRYGFYPRGGGRVKVRIKPSKLRALKILERGKYLYTDVYSIASKDLEKREVAERQAKEFKRTFREKIRNVSIKYVDSDSTGSLIHAHTCFENCKLGAEAIGEIKKRAEIVGKECAEKLLKEIDTDSTADTHMVDQLIPYLALYGGEIKTEELSMHAKTNMWVCEKFLPVKFRYENGVLKCEKQ